MRHLCKFLSAVVVVSLLSTAAQAAVVVNLDVNWSQSAGGGVTYTGTGAAPDSGTFWNGFVDPATSVTNLKASDGTTTTTVGFSFANASNIHYIGGVSNTAPDLLFDYLYESNRNIGANLDVPSPVTFSISGLTPGGEYDLYLYAINGGAALINTAFTIGATTQYVTYDSQPFNNGGPSGFVAGQNYTLFSDLAANGLGVISGSFSSADQDNYGVLNGFQIVQLVPEPGSIMLFAGAGILGLCRRRR
jgi:hypothetical protein